MKVAPLRIGTRGSPLALTQARMVAAMLGLGEESVLAFTTSGDRIQGRLQEVGGKGLFTRELDEALLDGRIDCAVHSMKDLPTRLPAGLALAAVPAREDPRDGFIARRARTLAELPAGATVGTASLRRQAQTLNARPDLKVELLRGRVETRLARIESGDFDATYLALAGLKRLGLDGHATSIVDIETMPPPPAQGALAITARAGDTHVLAKLKTLDIAEHNIATTAERAFLAALDGSCRTPIAALARIDAGRLRFIGEVLTPDGRHRWRRRGDCPATVHDAMTLGTTLGADIRAEAGPVYSAHVGDKGW
jgi:hydroxymethylbilane synthase